MLNKLHDVQNKNYVIYKFLLHTLKKDTTDESISFMVKTRNEKDTVDVNDLNMRIRLSTETDLRKVIRTTTKTKKSDSEPIAILDENLNKLITGSTIDFETRKILNNNIIFRLKERTSLIIEESD